MKRGVKKPTNTKTAVTDAPKKVIPSANSYVVLGQYVRESTGKIFKNKGHELEKGWRPLKGELEAGVTMAEEGRITIVEAKQQGPRTREGVASLKKGRREFVRRR